jgi:hypothetical protein
MKTKPNISNNFTIDAIHKIHEWHHEMRKEIDIEKHAKQLNKKVKTILADFPNAKIVAL